MGKKLNLWPSASNGALACGVVTVMINVRLARRDPLLPVSQWEELGPVRCAKRRMALCELPSLLGGLGVGSADRVEGGRSNPRHELYVAVTPASRQDDADSGNWYVKVLEVIVDRTRARREVAY